MSARAPVAAAKSDAAPATRESGVKAAGTKKRGHGELMRHALTSPGRPLDGTTRANMEARFGRSFADVRIHADERAAESARALDAAAFTAGQSIVFNAGRYAPARRDGALLLAHELAHVAHNARASQHRSGIAPETASAEHYADRAAAAALNASGAGSLAPEMNQWGPAWEIHRQVVKITQKGTVAHTGEIGRKPGEVGVPYGTVEVRTGEEIEFAKGGRLPNFIALAYTGSFSPDMQWLQFVWFELTAEVPAGTARVSGNVPTSSGNKPFSTDPKAPNWSIDSASSTSPFYEAAGANLRDAGSITMFDAPGGGSVTPLADAVFASGVGATKVTFTAHFETYLVQRNATVYVVAYQASTAFTQDAKGNTVVGAIGYTVGASGQVSALPADRKKLLDTQYPKFTAVK